MPYIPVLGTGDEGAIGYREVPVRRRRRRPPWVAPLVLLTWVAFVVYAVIKYGGRAFDLWLR